MTLKQIVEESKFWLGKERCALSGSGDEATEKLAECARRTLEKIALEYAPVIDVASVAAKGGRFALADLPLRAVAVKKVRQGRRTVAFRCLGETCLVDGNGVFDVEYHRLPSRPALEDECEVASCVSAKTAALGAAAEYCAIEGMPDLAEDFGDRFAEDMRAAVRVRREVRMPGRLWL